jgi:DNA-directed RNA polymerase specialized sigma24 family protein
MDTTARTEMVAWLQGDEALTAARSDLRRQGLDVYDPADVVHDVIVRILRTAADEAPIENAVGYARRAIQRRVTDLLRSDLIRDRHRAPVIRPTDEHPTGDPLDAAAPAPDPSPLASPADVAAVRAMEDAVRRALQLALATTRAWIVSASLGTLTLRVHPDVVIPDAAPVPENGDADAWAALWLAGETAAFPDPAGGRPDGPAVRKARSRRLQEVDRLLRTAAADALGLEEGVGRG